MTEFDLTKAVQGKGGTVYSCVIEHVYWMLFYQTTHDVIGGCQSACLHGLAAFPNLKLVRGLINQHSTELNLVGVEDHDIVDFFVNGFGIHRPHWWLETDEGYIVEGSWTQFTDPHGSYRAPFVCCYHAFPEHLKDKLPVGKCPNCGFHIYSDDSFGGVHTECFDEYKRYIESQSA